MILGVAGQQGWPWSVDLVADPDPILAASSEIVATADSRGPRPLPGLGEPARRVVEAYVPSAWIIDLTRQGD